VHDETLRTQHTCGKLDGVTSTEEPFSFRSTHLSAQEPLQTIRKIESQTFARCVRAATLFMVVGERPSKMCLPQVLHLWQTQWGNLYGRAVQFW
jgi:hypothetical protein